MQSHDAEYRESGEGWARTPKPASMTTPLSDTQLAAYRDLSFLDGAITQFDQTAAAVAATRALVREVDRLRAERLRRTEAEVDRLQMFGEPAHAERGVELENLHTAWREVRELLIHGAEASEVLDAMDRHDRNLALVKAEIARRADAAKGS